MLLCRKSLATLVLNTWPSSWPAWEDLSFCTGLYLHISTLCFVWLSGSRDLHLVVFHGETVSGSVDGTRVAILWILDWSSAWCLSGGPGKLLGRHHGTREYNEIYHDIPVEIAVVGQGTMVPRHWRPTVESLQAYSSLGDLFLQFKALCRNRWSHQLRLLWRNQHWDEDLLGNWGCDFSSRRCNFHWFVHRRRCGEDSCPQVDTCTYGIWNVLKILF